ncbi:unnamed protein product, partial [Brassica oleracea var. botrytis]
MIHRHVMLRLMPPPKPNSCGFKLVSFVFTRCQICGGVITQDIISRPSPRQYQQAQYYDV